MKVSINAGQFARALKPAIAVAACKAAVIPKEIALQFKSDKIIVIACGEATAIRHHISDTNYWNLGYSCEEEGMFNVNAIDFIKSLESFPSAESVIVQTDCDGKVAISDRQDIQFLPVSKWNGRLQPVCMKFKTFIKVNREVFVRGIRKVHFAIGIIKILPYHMVALLEAGPSKVRFAAGNGARFAVLDVRGEHITHAVREKTILLPERSLRNILKVLSEVPFKTITIIQSQATEEHDDDCHILIKFGSSTLFVPVPDPDIKYPHIDKVIEFDYPCKIISRASDWQYALRGIDATYTAKIKSEHDFHNVDVLSDFAENCVILEYCDKLRARRTVNISHFDVCDTDSKENTPQQFRCSSKYLLDMADKAGKNEEITIAFENQDVGETGKPILVTYPERINRSKGIREQFMMFFGVSRR